VTPVGGNYTVNFAPALHMPNWSTSNTVSLGWDNTANHRAVGVGLENFSVQFVFGSGANISVRNSYASWIKGLRIWGVGDNNGGLVTDRSQGIH
jgi:hypothetical protein